MVKTLINIIVPVYRGEAETKRCLDSVICSRNKASYQLIIINDASPDSQMESLLLSYLEKHSNILLLKNEINLGFVATVNRGMSLNEDSDIVLLNSDTEVANDWLDRLVAQAYKAHDIGTVTPFSNNGTICNYPDLLGWPELPAGEKTGFIDLACKDANSGVAVELPTAVGFCMYIKSECLNETGLFNVEIFGKGYGEENDFCLRASNLGWKHILAADIFVFHQGEVSFSESAREKKAAASKIIRDLYPYYESIVADHIKRNEAADLRRAITSARYRSGNRPVHLMISHSLGGGTEQHIQDLALAITKKGARVLILQPMQGDKEFFVRLKSYEQHDKLDIEIPSICLDKLSEELKCFGIKKCHLHHTLGFNFSIEVLLELIGVDYDITLHDYHLICPRINLITPGYGYCGQPHEEICNACLELRPVLSDAYEIIWWRSKSGSLLNGAAQIYCPSEDVKLRFQKLFPLANYRVSPHEELSLENIPNISREVNKLKVAILGVLVNHKGQKLVKEMVHEINQKRLPIQINLIGATEDEFPVSPSFLQTGKYQQDDLPLLLGSINPDLILFPTQCPETYSYTLSSAILSGRRIMAPNIGAFPERLRKINHAIIYPFNSNAKDLINLILKYLS